MQQRETLRARIGGLALFALAVVASPSAASAASILVNGDFETPAIAQGGFLTIAVRGEPSGFGWTVTTNSVDIVRSFNGFTPFQGAQNLDLVGTGSTGGIAQTFATAPGTTYEVSFRYANNPGAGTAAPAAQVTVVAGSTMLLSSTITHSGSNSTNMNWTPLAQTFVATGSSATLRFETTLGASGGGIYLDAVSVAVPEPSVSILLGAAAVSGFHLNRRKRLRASAPTERRAEHE
jgi:choice-of-anchor C domain-containing protein